MGLDAPEDLHHGAFTPFSHRFIGRAFLPGGTLVGWVANPSLVGRRVAALPQRERFTR